MSGSSSSLAEQSANRIADMILEEKRFQEGDKLPNEMELAELLSVSRVTLREAIRILVEIRRGRGTYVTSAGIDSASPDIRGLSAVESNAREMMEIRLIIEPSIAYYAALRGTEEEFQRIDEYRIRVEEVIAAGKNRTSAEQDFHNALAAATHNQFAMQLMQVVNKSIYLEVKYHEEGTNLATHSIPDHREIVNFLRRRNPDGAKAAMQMHILHAIQSSQERNK